MTTQKTNGEALAVEEIMAVLRQSVDRALWLLNAHINELELGEAPPANTMVKAAQDAHKAVLLLFEERKKIDHTFAKTAAGGGVLDLDLARAEIGRRLACLRNARGAGEVSD